jgi:WhiB family redox-sensing transcriptional regulator
VNLHPSSPEADWQKLAVCRGMDTTMFVLSEATRGTAAYRKAHRYCATCPVAAQCRDFALATGSWGLIFGGLDFTSRGHYRRTSGIRKDCEQCKQEYEAYTSRQRFCTNDCRDAYVKGHRR